MHRSHPRRSPLFCPSCASSSSLCLEYQCPPAVAAITWTSIRVGLSFTETTYNWEHSRSPTAHTATSDFLFLLLSHLISKSLQCLRPRIRLLGVIVGIICHFFQTVLVCSPHFGEREQTAFLGMLFLFIAFFLCLLDEAENVVLGVCERSGLRINSYIRSGSHVISREAWVSPS